MDHGICRESLDFSFEILQKKISIDSGGGVPCRSLRWMVAHSTLERREGRQLFKFQFMLSVLASPKT